MAIYDQYYKYSTRTFYKSHQIFRAHSSARFKNDLQCSDALRRLKYRLCLIVIFLMYKLGLGFLCFPTKPSKMRYRISTIYGDVLVTGGHHSATMSSYSSQPVDNSCQKDG